MSNLSSLTAPPSKKRLCINLKRIQSDKTLEYLRDNAIVDEEDLRKIMPICYLEGANSDFLKHSKSYSLPYNIEDVWQAYLDIPPKSCWTGNHIKFSFAYNPSNGNFHYKGDKYRGLEESQLIFIEIRLLFGLVKLAVTHQVNQVNHAEKRIKLCYVQGGKSAGSQFLEMTKVSENETNVVHNTFYKSNSKFRDKRLYPFLHEFIINQFHKNVRKYLQGEGS